MSARNTERDRQTDRFGRAPNNNNGANNNNESDAGNIAIVGPLIAAVIPGQPPLRMARDNELKRLREATKTMQSRLSEIGGLFTGAVRANILLFMAILTKCWENIQMTTCRNRTEYWLGTTA